MKNYLISSQESINPASAPPLAEYQPAADRKSECTTIACGINSLAYGQFQQAKITAFSASFDNLALSKDVTRNIVFCQVVYSARLALVMARARRWLSPQ